MITTRTYPMITTHVSHDLTTTGSVAAGADENSHQYDDAAQGQAISNRQLDRLGTGIMTGMGTVVGGVALGVGAVTEGVASLLNPSGSKERNAGDDAGDSGK